MSWWNALAGGLGAIGGVIGQNAASRNARQNTDRTIAANRELAELGYNRDIERWNIANEYNTPLAQMKRLQEAGINPHLAFAKGAPQNVSSPTLPKYNPPRQDYNYQPAANLAHTLSGFQNFAIQQAQIDNLKSNSERNKTSNLLDLAKIPGVNSDNIVKSANAEVAKNLQPYNIEAGINKSKSSAQELEAAQLGNQLKKLEVDLQKKGFSSRDKWQVKMLIRAYDALGYNVPGVSQIIQRINKELD